MRCHALSTLLIGAFLNFLAALQPAYGAGFALYEGSARGNALGGAMVGRADDPSAIFYNPAGITQLKGEQVEAGATLIDPSTTVETLTPMGKMSTDTKDNYWLPPHAYGTYQINDRWWAGLGLYSRFGLGTEFPENWPGRYNSYNAQIRSFTLNPDIAVKLGKLSLAAGVSAEYFDLKLQRKIPTGTPVDYDMTLEGDAVGYGYNVAAHYAFSKWLALGAAYWSSVEEDVDGDATIGPGKTDASGEIKLPDMLFLGLMISPIDKLSLEIGAVRTGWSTYDQLMITFDNPALAGPSATTPKNWEDVWRYQAGLEYKVTEKLDLRLGYVYDEEPIPDDTVDYLVPANDRQLYSIGFGYHWTKWTLDVSYSYLSISDRSVSARPSDGIPPSQFKDGDAHMVGVSVSTKL